MGEVIDIFFYLPRKNIYDLLSLPMYDIIVLALVHIHSMIKKQNFFIILVGYIGTALIVSCFCETLERHYHIDEQISEKTIYALAANIQLFCVECVINPNNNVTKQVLFYVIPILNAIFSLIGSLYYGLRMEGGINWIVSSIGISILVVVIKMLKNGAAMTKNINKVLANSIAGIISLIAILCGFLVLKDWAHSLFWLIFVLISYPVILSIVMRPDTLGAGDIRSMYRDGVKNIPIFRRKTDGSAR